MHEACIMANHKTCLLNNMRAFIQIKLTTGIINFYLIHPTNFFCLLRIFLTS